MAPTMFDDEKWVDLAQTQNCVSAAARLTLLIRIESVMHWLRLAASSASENLECVHQLRVASRRALAALDAYEQVLPKAERKWFVKQMNRVRTAAGDARDLDVLLGQTACNWKNLGKKLHRKLCQQRMKVQSPISELHRKLIVEGRLSDHSRRLLDSIQRVEADTLHNFAKSRVTNLTERMIEVVPADFHDLRALHRFRIYAKQLKYTLELFASVLPEPFTAELYPLLGEIQSKLGELNDRVVAKRTLKRLCKHVSSKRRLNELQQTVKQEQMRIRQCRSEFAAWWSPIETALRYNWAERLS